MITEIKSFSEIFFEKLNIEIDSLEVEIDENQKVIIKIQTPDSELLIWEHWVIFENIQGIFRTIFSNKYDKKVKLKFKINNYKHNKDSKLFAMIDEKISLCIKTWEKIELPYLNAYERKKVHSYVHSLKNDSIKSKSIGEWNNRKLFIILSWNKITSKRDMNISHLEIDIDWNDI